MMTFFTKGKSKMDLCGGTEPSMILKMMKQDLYKPMLKVKKSLKLKKAFLFPKFLLKLVKFPIYQMIKDLRMQLTLYVRN